MMEPFFKVAAVLFVFSFAAVMCGVLTSAESSIQNMTPVNETLSNITQINTTEESITEEDIIEDQGIYEEELTPGEIISIREGEKAEEAAMSEEEPEQIEEETNISPVETTEEPTIEETIEEPVITPAKASSEPAKKEVSDPVNPPEKKIFVEEKKEPVKTTPREVVLKKTVNASGFVFVGTKYAGEEVIVTMEG